MKESLKGESIEKVAMLSFIHFMSPVVFHNVD